MVEKEELLGALGERLRALRTSRGLSIEELAARAGTHSSNGGAIERGERNPTVFMLARIADALGLELETLIDFREAASAKELRRRLSARVKGSDSETLRLVLRLLDTLG